jgi:hypothetical protein
MAIVLSVLLFFLWPLCCLSFFDLQILINPLVFSNSSYITIPYTLLESSIKELIQRWFSKKKEEQRYQYLVIGRDKSYFVKSTSKSSKKYDEIIKSKDIKLAQSFNSSFFYIDDVLPQNNSHFGDYLHLIYPTDLDVNDTTDTQKSASSIVNFPFISSNILAS